MLSPDFGSVFLTWSGQHGTACFSERTKRFNSFFFQLTWFHSDSLNLRKSERCHWEVSTNSFCPPEWEERALANHWCLQPFGSFWSSKTGIKHCTFRAVMVISHLLYPSIVLSYFLVLDQHMSQFSCQNSCKTQIQEAMLSCIWESPESRLKARRKSCWQPDTHTHTHTLRSLSKSSWTLKSLQWMALLIPKLLILIFKCG